MRSPLMRQHETSRWCMGFEKDKLDFEDTDDSYAKFLTCGDYNDGKRSHKVIRSSFDCDISSYNGKKACIKSMKDNERNRSPNYLCDRGKVPYVENKKSSFRRYDDCRFNSDKSSFFQNESKFTQENSHEMVCAIDKEFRKFSTGSVGEKNVTTGKKSQCSKYFERKKNDTSFTIGANRFDSKSNSDEKFFEMGKTKRSLNKQYSVKSCLEYTSKNNSGGYNKKNLRNNNISYGSHHVVRDSTERITRLSKKGVPYDDRSKITGYKDTWYENNRNRHPSIRHASIRHASIRHDGRYENDRNQNHSRYEDNQYENTRYGLSRYKDDGEVNGFYRNVFQPKSYRINSIENGSYYYRTPKSFNKGYNDCVDSNQNINRKRIYSRKNSSEVLPNKDWKVKSRQPSFLKKPKSGIDEKLKTYPRYISRRTIRWNEVSVCRRSSTETSRQKGSRTKQKTSPAHRRSVLEKKKSRVSSTSKPRKHRKPKKKKRSGTSANRSSTDIVHFQWHTGMWLNERYRVLGLLGEGTFGRVLECIDTKSSSKRHVAVKVVRDVERYTSAAKIEGEILQEIQKRDPRNDSGCVRLFDMFLHNKHMCLVFEKLGLSLYECLARNGYKGFFLRDIQAFSHHCLRALAFMFKLKLTHTDMKPENILLECGADEFDVFNFPRGRGKLRRPNRADVRIIDFGSATFEEEYHCTVINTRQYRAPEVILDIGWDMSSDVWSLGCILMELYTGELLFKTHEHMEHLAMMEKIIGRIPEYMVRKARNTDGKAYLNPSYSTLNWPEGASSSNSLQRVRDCRPLEEFVLPQHKSFAKFVAYLLRLDPKERPTPEEALRHEFLGLENIVE